jgi:hypothetical protein
LVEFNEFCLVWSVYRIVRLFAYSVDY